jgi:putative phosphoesterase
MRIALISDVHGNRWALEAALDDIERRRCDLILNLGDCVYGPLDPSGTASLLMNLEAPTIRGNQDRILTTPVSEVTDNPTFEFVTAELTKDQIAWFGWLDDTRTHGDVYMCHGTPQSDSSYLLEDTSGGTGVIRENEEITGELDGIDASIIACGHSHLQRVVKLSDDRLCINPGSVGLPAYTDDTGGPHKMESGSPHARYSIIERVKSGRWNVHEISLVYDWDSAAHYAELNDRPDWARWIRTGRVF